MIEQQANAQVVLVLLARGDYMGEVLGYSGYVEHSDFYIDPQEYYEAFKFLVELAVGSGETVFYIGKAIDNGYDFNLEDVMQVVWNGYSWVKGE